MKDREVKELMVSLVAGIVAGGVFLGLLFLLKWNLLIDIILAVGIFVSVSLIAKPRNRIGKICVENIINGEELHRRLEEAMEDFSSIENSFKKIEDESVKEQVKSLKATAEKSSLIWRNIPKKSHRQGSLLTIIRIRHPHFCQNTWSYKTASLEHKRS